MQLFDNNLLNGKHALICGASKGIGRACAETFANHGATLTLLARSQDALKDLIASLPNSDRHKALAIDLMSPNLSVDLKSGLAGRDVDILINNTGGPAAGPLNQAATDSLSNAFMQHVVANQTLLQAVLPNMQKNQWGRVINIISTSVKAPIKGLGVSNTIRGAVASWAKTLAGELGQYNITVNNVLPGFTDTERLNYIFENRAKKQDRELAEVIQTAKNSVPMARFARPEETAMAVMFLASDAASYINGINLPVDGGRTQSL